MTRAIRLEIEGCSKRRQSSKKNCGKTVRVGWSLTSTEEMMAVLKSRPDLAEFIVKTEM